MDKNVPIYLDGLERSGNVYLANVVRATFDHDVISLRTHRLETLVNYKKENPFIVPVRDAFDSIASSRVYRKHVYENNLFGDNSPINNSIDVIIWRYDKYFDFLIDSPKFFIAPFNSFIENHDELINKIIKFHENRLVLKVFKMVTTEDLFNDIHDPKLKSNYGEHSFSPELGNFPRERSKDRAAVELELMEKYSDDIKRIQGKVDTLHQRYHDIKI